MKNKETYDTVRTIRIELPEHLIDWLEKFSKQVAMTPSQLLANILEYYREIWSLGKEMGIRECRENKIDF